MTEPIQHGGRLDRAMAVYGGARSDWLDLSTGINPRPYRVPALESHVWARLPDEALTVAAIGAARHYYGVADMVALLPVAGAQAAIQCLPALLPDGGVHIVEPCYGEYGHVLDPQRRAPRDAANTVILANPNNPDGQTHDRAFVEALLAAGKTVIIDEAFCDVAPAQSLIGLAERSHVLIMKSFGKFFGLAGVRLGFVMGDAAMVATLERQLGPWAVSGPALAIGAQALADDAWISASRQWLSAQRGTLQAMLDGLGFEPVGATDLFVTVAHPRAAQIANTLVQSRILVRPFDYAPHWLRFGLPKDEGDMDRLHHALASAL